MDHKKLTNKRQNQEIFNDKQPLTGQTFIKLINRPLSDKESIQTKFLYPKQNECKVY